MADREVSKRRFVPAPLALTAWLLVLACSLAPAPALADGHFRYGTLSWAPSASGMFADTATDVLASTCEHSCECTGLLVHEAEKRGH